MCWTHTSRGLFKYGHLTYDRQTKVVRHVLLIDNNTVIILLHEQIKTFLDSAAGKELFRERKGGEREPFGCHRTEAHM